MRVSKVRKTAGTKSLYAKGKYNSHNIPCIYGQNHTLPTWVIGSKIGSSSGLQQCKWSALIDDNLTIRRKRNVVIRIRG